MPDDFLVFAIGLDSMSPTVCGLAAAATTLTVRLEDVWFLLPSGRRALSYSCAVTRDPHTKDAPSAQTDGIVRETIESFANGRNTAPDNQESVHVRTRAL